DESFAGYRRYADAQSLERQAHHLRAIRPLVRLLAAAAPAGVRGSGHLALLGMTPLERYFRMMTYQSDASLGELFTPDARSLLTPLARHDRLVRLAAESGTEEYLSRLQYIDIHHYLPDDILTKIDRTSMLVSLETRVPLLDHILMEHVAAMPPVLTLRGGAGNYVSKQAMRNLLPLSILTRSKMGFAGP